jgi:hypothetical protein
MDSDAAENNYVQIVNRPAEYYYVQPDFRILPTNPEI